MSEKRVVVAGAGLVGSLLAIILKRRGHQVTLLEKRSDMRKAEGGAGRSINLIVTSRGINALQRVDLWDKVKSITVPVHGRMMHAHNGELTYQAYGRDESECNYSISRGGLNILLLNEAEAAGVAIKFEHDVESVDIDNKKIIFEQNKSDIEYDLLFGTDGGGSKVRKSLIQKVEGAEESADRLFVDYKEMLMPAVENGEHAPYAMAKNSLHIWPRGEEMLMALPNQDGSFTMTLYMAQDKFKKVNSEQKLSEYFSKEYRDSIPFMPDFQKEYFENPQGKLVTLRCSPWTYKNSVALLGDAAHAIVPFFGQGMNAGLEDCYYLMKFFDESNDWGECFKRYNDFQKPNGDAIADLAIENFRIMSEKVADERFLFKKAAEKKIEKTYPEIYRARYGMVTYTLIPYSEVKAAGVIQEEILEELCEGINDLNQLDMQKALKLIESKFTPFIKSKNINLKRFQE